MVDVGTIKFYNARVGVSGLGFQISQLGSGVTDHVGFFGPNGHVSAITVGQFQDTTIAVDDAGTPPNTTFGGTAYLTNNKQNGPSGVIISGLPEGPYDVKLTKVNRFLAANLAVGKYPDFLHRNSGTLLITYEASGASQVHIFNPKFFAFDNTATIDDSPPDVSVFGYEINGSGQWFNASVSGVWQQTTGRDSPIFLTNHSPANGWLAKNKHYFVLGLSVKPNSVGVLDLWDMGFQLQFA